MPNRPSCLRVVLAVVVVFASSLFSSGLPVARADVPPTSFTFGAAGDFGAGTNAVQTITFSPFVSGTPSFTLTFNGYTTPLIAFSSSTATLASERTALPPTLPSPASGRGLGRGS